MSLRLSCLPSCVRVQSEGGKWSCDYFDWSIQALGKILVGDFLLDRVLKEVTHIVPVTRRQVRCVRRHRRHHHRLRRRLIEADPHPRGPRHADQVFRQL